MNTRAKNKSICTSSALAIVAATLALLPACGKQQFQKTTNTVSASGAGAYAIPAKVDVVVFQDDTGSMMSAQAEMQSKAASLLQDLSNSGWDYRFMILPLTQKRTMAAGSVQIAASQQDLNWKNESEGWSPPYPGMDEMLADRVLNGFFARPYGYGYAPTFSNWLTDGETHGTAGSVELGLKNITEELTGSTRLNSIGFARNDALLVPIVIGNGDDTETFGYGPSCSSSPYGSYQYTHDCDKDNNYPVLHSYANQILSSKGNNVSKIRLFAAVSTIANRPLSSCYGGDGNNGITHSGSRYQVLAAALNGRSYDLCTRGVSGIFDDIKGALLSVKQTYRQKYLFIAEEPVQSSITITKYIGGSASNAVSIPFDSTNGWTYAGYQTNLNAVDYPTPMFPQTGYAIELHGSAKLVGDDRADVKYTTP